MLQKLVGIMIIENITSNLRCGVRSAVEHEFNNLRNMALYYFRLLYAGRFAKECYSRKEIFGY